MSVYLHVRSFISDERIAHKGLGSQRTLHSHDEGEQRLMNTRCPFGAVLHNFGEIRFANGDCSSRNESSDDFVAVNASSFPRDKVELCLI